MTEIIDFNIHKHIEQTSQISHENRCPSEELGTAIQSLIQQLRTAPLQRTG